MPRSSLLRPAAILCLLSSATGVLAARVNPLTVPSTLPFQAPRFDQITDADYQPAPEQGMAEQIAEMKRIANDPAAPTFANTIEAMERSGRMLDRASQAFFGVSQANTNDALDKVRSIEAPKLAQHSDAIYLDPKLFARVQALYAKRDTLGLDAEQRQVLEIYHSDFLHAGAQLNDSDEAKLRLLTRRSRPRRPTSSRSCSPAPRRARWWSTTRRSSPDSVTPRSRRERRARRRGAFRANTSSRSRTRRNSRHSPR
jgi:peptidyl-dipeptidase Dcp